VARTLRRRKRLAIAIEFTLHRNRSFLLIARYRRILRSYRCKGYGHSS